MSPLEAGPPSTDGQADYLPLRATRPPAVGRWVGVTIVLVVVAWLVYTIVVTPNIHWDVVVGNLTNTQILQGLWVTIQLTVISMVIGVAIGVVIAVMQLSESQVLRAIAGAYTWFFRGTPLLVQLLFWFNLGLLFPRIEFGVPFGGPKLFGFDASIITPFAAGLLGLSINEGAYMSQIVRAGIVAVDHGQREAAESLGMTKFRVLSRIVLPQAMRIIVPPTGNQFISMLKTTSLVSVIAGADLLTVTQHIYLQNFEVISMLVVASIWYLVLTTIASIGQHYLERHFSRGFNPSVDMRNRIKGNLLGRPAKLPTEGPS